MTGPRDGAGSRPSLRPVRRRSVGWVVTQRGPCAAPKRQDFRRRPLTRSASEEQGRSPSLALRVRGREIGVNFDSLRREIGVNSDSLSERESTPNAGTECPSIRILTGSKVGSDSRLHAYPGPSRGLLWET